ncbi:hypothetical protein ACS0TY_022937 [Phlomoides rotata]
MIFKKARDDREMATLLLNEVPFWVQIHGLQLRMQNKLVGETLGSKIDKVLEVDTANEEMVWAKCLHVRVLVDVSKPLVRGTRVEMEGSKLIVIFRYEKLGELCFVCGRLNHVDRDCPSVALKPGEALKEKHQYKTWLRADGTKPVSVDEISRSIKKKTPINEWMQGKEDT